MKEAVAAVGGCGRGADDIFAGVFNLYAQKALPVVRGEAYGRRLLRMLCPPFPCRTDGVFQHVAQHHGEVNSRDERQVPAHGLNAEVDPLVGSHGGVVLQYAIQLPVGAEALVGDVNVLHGFVDVVLHILPAAVFGNDGHHAQQLPHVVQMLPLLLHILLDALVVRPDDGGLQLPLAFL